MSDEKQPVSTFHHADDCPIGRFGGVPSVEELPDGSAVIERCVCGTRHRTLRRAGDDRPAAPDPSVLTHGCSYVPSPRWDADGYWRVSCPECGVSTVVVPYERGAPVPANAAVRGAA